MTARQPVDRHAVTSGGEVQAPPTDFMFTGYALIKEPLNLEAGGQEWVRKLFGHHGNPEASNGLILGATPWMIEMLGRRGYRNLVVVDMSKAMLCSAETALAPVLGESMKRTEFCESKWLEMRQPSRPFDTVLGDNSFSFLKFPADWSSLCNRLADMMSPCATLVARCLSVPQKHTALSVGAIVDKFLPEQSINYTEVRANLLFAQWNEKTWSIDTERVLDEFQSHRMELEPLFEKFGVGEDNDLLTVRKYRGAGAVYYAPPLPALIDVIEERFRITAIHFGSYRLGEYFPLVVASRK